MAYAIFDAAYRRRLMRTHQIRGRYYCTARAENCAGAQRHGLQSDNSPCVVSVSGEVVVWSPTARFSRVTEQHQQGNLVGVTLIARVYELAVCLY